MSTRSKSGNNQTDQDNHHKSTGPRTTRGKKISSRNAQKHGLLCKELFVSKDEKPMLEQLKRGVYEDLQPDCTVLFTLADDIVACQWSLMKCVSCKHQYLQERQQSTTADTAPIASSAADLRGDWNISRRLRLLNDLRNDVWSTGWISDRWREWLIGAFGQTFCDILMQWHATGGHHLIMHEMLIQKRQLLGSDPQPDDKQLSDAAERQALLEAPLRRQIVLKLIELEEGFLVAQGTEMSSRDSRSSDRLELLQRYETTERRNLHRAIREYVQVKRDLRSLHD